MDLFKMVLLKTTNIRLNLLIRETPMSQTRSINLRSGENGALYVPFSRTVLYGGAFSCSAPRKLMLDLIIETQHIKA